MTGFDVLELFRPSPENGGGDGCLWLLATSAKRLQLAKAGFIARGGQIIDASIVSGPVQHNRSEESDAIKRCCSRFL